MQMAESQSGATSSVVLKEKNSLLDDDIGKEFLSSWKSMSVTEDDAMDFNFEPADKGKKKTFNFDKLNMDFTLDGDFDKVSSFKVDMSDLDFSCSPKKNAKLKERSEEESTSGNREGKQDCFNFSFDFNEMDNFNFDSSLMKGDKKSRKYPDSKEITSDRSECQGSRFQLAEGVSIIDDGLTIKLPASESLTTTKNNTLNGGCGVLSSINDDPPLKSATDGNLVVSQRGNTSPEKTITTSTGETEQKRQLPEKIISTEPYTQQIIQDLSVQSVHGNDSTQDTVSVLQTEVCCLDTKVNTIPGGEKSKMILDMGSNHENSHSKNSAPQQMSGPPRNNSEMNKLGCNNDVPVQNIDGCEPAQADLDLEDTSITSVSRKMLIDTKASRENQNSTSKLLLAPLSSGLMADKLIPIKGKEAGGIRSKFFKRSEETESQLHQGASTQTKIISPDSKKIGTVHSSATNERREGSDANGAQIGRKVVGNSRSHAGGLTKGEPVLLGSEKNITDFNNISVQMTVSHMIFDREGSNAVGAQNGNQLTDKSRQHEATNGEPVLLGSEKNVNGFNSFGSRVSPSSSTEQTTKSITQKCVNPKLVVSSMASIRSSKIISVGGNRLSSLKAARRTPDLSSLRTSRPIGTNNDLSNSTFQKEIKSLRNSEQKVEVQENPASKMVHSVGTEKKTLLTLSLKRKMYEASNADLTLNPLKRRSPSESRNKEASLRVAEGQVCNHESLVDSNVRNPFFDCPTSTVDIPREMNITELEIPLVMENDGSVEKAEAYTKELEDICNMLKKKHNEAKELLVRAIVNNNHLLMLNHPIYEEKIRSVQKFAAQLMSREIHT